MVIADFGRWPSSTMPCHHSDAACQRAGFISDRAVQADRQCEVYRASDNMEFMFRLLANFNFAATLADIAEPPRDAVVADNRVKIGRVAFRLADLGDMDKPRSTPRSAVHRSAPGGQARRAPFCLSFNHSLSHGPKHLTEAKKILAQFGPSQKLTRVETALTELGQ